MKISKRDIQLLILLGLVAFVAAYYWFIFVPQTEKLKALQDNQAIVAMERSDIQRRIDIAPTLVSNIEAATEKLLKASQRYYGDLYQEELVMTINELAEGTSLNVKGITFAVISGPLSDAATSLQESLGTAATGTAVDPNAPVPAAPNAAVTDPNAPASQGTTPVAAPAPVNTTGLNPDGTPIDPLVTQLNTITAIVQYEGYYSDLEAFMYNLYKYPKQMVLQSVNITSNTEGLLNGVITIDFYGLPKIALIDAELKSYFKELSKRTAVSDVFLPYETFVIPTPEPTEPIDLGGDESDSETDIMEEVQPNKMISSFEDFSYFFIGDKPSIVGSASRTSVRTNGSFGLKLNYNFVEPRKVNTASVVFDQSPILVSDQGTALALSVYSEVNLKHRIGAELVDSVGKSYDVTFALELTPTGWQEIEAPLPKEINYPFVIKRIFFEGTGFDQQLVAEVILDELKVLLPDLGGDQ